MACVRVVKPFSALILSMRSINSNGYNMFTTCFFIQNLFLYYFNTCFMFIIRKLEMKVNLYF